MDKEKKLEGIASTYLIECRGNNENNKLTLSPWRKQKVIVKIYRDGSSMPLCKYLSGDNDHKCSANNKDDFAYCPYRSFRGTN